MNRSYRVHLNSDVSNVVAVDCGVPQGSSPGPKMFIAYVEDMGLGEIFAVRNISRHCSADDTQSYTDAPLSQARTVADKLQRCIIDVADWCGSRRLQLNTAKTELMWFGSSTSLQSMSSLGRSIVVGEDLIQPSKCAHAVWACSLTAR